MKTIEMLAGLKSCPFCGRKPLLLRELRYPLNEEMLKKKETYRIACVNPECCIYKGSELKYYSTAEDAINTWNRRFTENDNQAVPEIYRYGDEEA